MPPITSMLGPIGSLFGISTGIYKLIENGQVNAATQSFRSSVTTDLTQIIGTLKVLGDNDTYTQALIQWNTNYSTLNTNLSNIDTLWTQLDMNYWMGSGAHKSSEGSFTGLPAGANISLLDIPGYLANIDNAVTIGCGYGQPALIPSFIQLQKDYYAAYPDIAQPTSLSELAYSYWWYIIQMQCKALVMFQLACYFKIPGCSQQALQNWFPQPGIEGTEGIYAAEQKLVIYQQGGTVQSQINNALNVTYGYDAFCGVLPPESLVTLLPESMIGTRLFQNSLAQIIPEGTVLVSWRLMGQWDTGKTEWGVMWPQLYYGTVDPTTGYVDPSSIQMININNEPPSTDNLSTGDMELYNSNNPGDPIDTGLGNDLGAYVDFYWLLANTSNNPPTSSQYTEPIPTTPLVSVSLEMGYSPSIPFRNWECTMSYVYLKASTGPGNSLQPILQIPNPTPIGYGVYPTPLGSIAAAQFLSFGCPCADTLTPPVTNTLLLEDCTFSSQMSPVTDTGLGSYVTPNGVTVLAPRNYYTTHLYMFAS